MSLLDKIKTMITPLLEQHDCYLDDLEYVKEQGEWYLRIYVDKNNGSLDMDTCVAVSEDISAKLDEVDPIEGEYYLEVSSPGAERPLKSYEQVEKAVGQYVCIWPKEPVDGFDEIYGTILDCQDGCIHLEYLVKNIKKKCQINYENIESIRLAVKF